MPCVRSLARRELNAPADLQNAILLLRNEVATLTKEKRELSRRLAAQSVGLRRDIQNVQNQHLEETERYKSTIAAMEQEVAQAHRTRLAFRAAKSWRHSLSNLREDLFSIRHALMQYKGFAFGGASFTQAPQGRLGSSILATTSPVEGSSLSGGGVVSVLRNAFLGVAELQERREEGNKELKEAFDMLTSVIENRCQKPSSDNHESPMEMGSRSRSRLISRDGSFSPASGRSSPPKEEADYPVTGSKGRRRTISRSFVSPSSQSLASGVAGKARKGGGSKTRLTPSSDNVFNVDFTAFATDGATLAPLAKADSCVNMLMDYCEAMEECWRRREAALAEEDGEALVGDESIVRVLHPDEITEHTMRGRTLSFRASSASKGKSPHPYSRSLASAPQSAAPSPIAPNLRQSIVGSSRGLHKSPSPTNPTSRLSPQTSIGRIRGASLPPGASPSMGLPRSGQRASYSLEAATNTSYRRRDTVVTIASTPSFAAAVVATEDKATQTIAAVREHMVVTPADHAPLPSPPKQAVVSEAAGSRAPSSYRSAKKEAGSEDAQSVCMSVVELTFPRYPAQSGTNTIGHLMRPVAVAAAAPKALGTPRLISPSPQVTLQDGLTNPHSRQLALEHKAAIVAPFIALRKCFKLWVRAHRSKTGVAAKPNAHPIPQSEVRPVVTMHVASYAVPTGLPVPSSGAISKLRPSSAPQRRLHTAPPDGALLAYRPQRL
eukprot:GILJ01020184.1.p1 GENE.GILJ01020184.1~~GILJ01020184.1.p1  ORF type:complete len:720 (-),score=80.19 GILJ01020184.1:64-2223(-)